jgi:hypothetical protein
MAHEALKIILGLDNVLSDRVMRFCASDYSLTIHKPPADIG